MSLRHVASYTSCIGCYLSTMDASIIFWGKTASKHLMTLRTGSRRILDLSSRRHFYTSPTTRYCVAQKENGFSVYTKRITIGYDWYPNRPQGLTFDCKYLDTHGENETKSKDLPTIVAVHGTPGTHKDFLPIVPQLVKEGFRVVALNIPGNI